MELFDKKFVYFVWDDALEGKEGFVADDICDLTNNVLSGNRRFTTVSKSLNPASPFKDINSNSWKFFYFDPNYECKVTYTKGKRIQFKSKGSDAWLESDFAPRWNDRLDYRIKPESNRMTYRELSEWLAKGHGQQSSTECSVRYTFQEVTKEDENKEVPVDYKIRRWGSDEWIEPTVDVYNNDVKGE